MQWAIWFCTRLGRRHNRAAQCRHTPNPGSAGRAVVWAAGEHTAHQTGCDPTPPEMPASSCNQRSMAQDAAANATDTIRQAPKPSTMLLPT